MKIDVGLDPHVCSLGTVLSQLPETTDSSRTKTSYISPNINESYKVQSGRQDIWRACVMREMHTKFWLGSLKGRDYL
jgi:hypothetical protein